MRNDANVYAELLNGKLDYCSISRSENLYWLINLAHRLPSLVSGTRWLQLHAQHYIFQRYEILSPATFSICWTCLFEYPTTYQLQLQWRVDSSTSHMQGMAASSTYRRMVCQFGPADWQMKDAFDTFTVACARQASARAGSKLITSDECWEFEASTFPFLIQVLDSSDNVFQAQDKLPQEHGVPQGQCMTGPTLAPTATTTTALMGIQKTTTLTSTQTLVTTSDGYVSTHLKNPKAWSSNGQHGLVSMSSVSFSSIETHTVTDTTTEFPWTSSPISTITMPLSYSVPAVSCAAFKVTGTPVVTYRFTPTAWGGEQDLRFLSSADFGFRSALLRFFTTDLFYPRPSTDRGLLFELGHTLGQLI